MPIESNRMIGGVAAALFVMGIISQVIAVFTYAFNLNAANPALLGVAGTFGVLAFVALVLFFVAMYGFSKDYGDGRIFSYLVTGLVAVIVVGVVAGVILGGFIVIFGASTLFSNTGGASVLERSFLPALPVFATVGLVWIVFNVRALNLLGDKSKVALFRTGAKVLLAGSIVTVVVTAVLAAVSPTVNASFNALETFTSFPGGLTENFGWLLLAMAYFRIKGPAPPTTTPFNASPIPPAVYGQAKLCPSCSAANVADAVYCTRCGRKIMQSESEQARFPGEGALNKEQVDKGDKAGGADN